MPKSNIFNPVKASVFRKFDTFRPDPDPNLFGSCSAPEPNPNEHENQDPDPNKVG